MTTLGVLIMRIGYRKILKYLHEMEILILLLNKLIIREKQYVIPMRIH